MTFEDEADIDVFFDDGDAAIYTPATGAAVSPLRGHFSRPFAGALGFDGIEVASSDPTFLCATARLPATAQAGGADQLTVKGAVWRVVSIEAVADGATSRLILATAV